MKLVKVWWDFDDERHSQQAFLLEEDNPDDIIYKETEEGPEECNDEFYRFAGEAGVVIFKETANDDIFAIPAESVVKIQVLEE